MSTSAVAPATPSEGAPAAPTVDAALLATAQTSLAYYQCFDVDATLSRDKREKIAKSVESCMKALNLLKQGWTFEPGRKVGPAGICLQCPTLLQPRPIEWKLEPEDFGCGMWCSPDGKSLGGQMRMLALTCGGGLALLAKDCGRFEDWHTTYKAQVEALPDVWRRILFMIHMLGVTANIVTMKDMLRIVAAGKTYFDITVEEIFHHARHIIASCAGLGLLSYHEGKAWISEAESELPIQILEADGWIVLRPLPGEAKAEDQDEVLKAVHAPIDRKTIEAKRVREEEEELEPSPRKHSRSPSQEN